MTNKYYKDTQISDRERLALTLIGVMMVIIVTLISGCNNEKPNLGYANAGEAVDDYSSLLARLHDKHKYTDEELVSIIKQWKATDDSVTVALARDSIGVGSENDNLSQRYLGIRDSITDRLFEIIESKPRTFNDYLNVAIVFANNDFDTATEDLINKARSLYEEAGARPTFGVGSRETIKMYESVLQEAISKPFSNKETVYGFLADEDRAFRSFLSHLPTLGNIPLAGVRDNSKTAIGNIVALADGKQPMLTTTEVVVLLTVRNNRRLIQNAERCAEDITKGRVRAGDQATAYMWMLLQPWISFDSLSYSLMDEPQIKSMKQLATKMPEMITMLKLKDFPMDTDELPALLMKSAILQ